MSWNGPWPAARTCRAQTPISAGCISSAPRAPIPPALITAADSPGAPTPAIGANRIGAVIPKRRQKASARSAGVVMSVPLGRSAFRGVARPGRVATRGPERPSRVALRLRPYDRTFTKLPGASSIGVSGPSAGVASGDLAAGFRLQPVDPTRPPGAGVLGRAGHPFLERGGEAVVGPVLVFFLPPGH